MRQHSDQAPDDLTVKPAAIASNPISEFSIPPGLSTADLPVSEIPEAMIGHFRLLEKIGEGGFGVVYVAEQKTPVRRRVALKVIKLGMDTRSIVARFEAERQALAMMDHPNIAKVFDAGATETGRPYFVMELVRGIKITEYCDQNKLPTRARLDLFIKVCQAIQHAHQKGVIHRDIKPSNILVTLHDGVPVPKVIDFGIAKATQGDLTDKTVYTQYQQFIGTPAYMSPEQAEMSGLDVDTRSDIYSLGVLLYELLTGRTPFDATELMSMGIDAIRKAIREKEPIKPSTRVAALQGEELNSTAARRSSEAPRLIHLLRGDLDWIVMKCLEKDRTRRYETANGLAVDLQRHLSNEPVLARPPSTAYRLQKAFGRNKVVFTSAIAILAALILGIAGTTIGLVRAERQKRAAEASKILAERRFSSAQQFVNDVFQKVAPEFSDLVGASKAKEQLVQVSLTFLQSLGDSKEGDDEYQASLAALYARMSDALGGVYSPNALGDYDAALKFANQSLTIRRDLLARHPTDLGNLQQVGIEEVLVGAILQASDRPGEAEAHYRRFLEVAEKLSQAKPNDPAGILRIRTAHLHIGGAIADQGRVREALEQYVLPYAKEWLARPVSLSANKWEDEWTYVAQWQVGDFSLKLDRAQDASEHLGQALRWNQLFTDNEPNNARWPRDWCTLRAELGAAQIALGQVDQGAAGLKEAVDRAQTLVARDPANALTQSVLLDVLHKQADGWAKQAALAGNSRQRQADLWQRTIETLFQCEAQAASPALDRMRPALAKQMKEIQQSLENARAAYAKVAAQADSRPAP